MKIVCKNCLVCTTCSRAGKYVVSTLSQRFRILICCLLSEFTFFATGRLEKPKHDFCCLSLSNSTEISRKSLKVIDIVVLFCCIQLASKLLTCISTDNLHVCLFFSAGHPTGEDPRGAGELHAETRGEHH